MIKVISTHLADHRFVIYQKKLLDKFMKNEYELIIFDDSQNPNNHFNMVSDSFTGDLPTEMEIACRDLEIKRIPVPPSIHINPAEIHHGTNFLPNDPAGWCANSVQYSVNWCFSNLDDDDIVFSIDGDMFPISPMDLSGFLEDYDLCGVPQVRDDINYLWNGIFSFRVGKINRDLFQWGLLPGCDVGGRMKYYLDENPRYKKIYHLPSMTWNYDRIKNTELMNYLIPEKIKMFTDKDPRNVRSGDEELFFSEIYQPGFFHYRASGNWDNYNKHEERKSILFQFFNSLLDE